MRFSSLDGLRALAILGVVAFHTVGHVNALPRPLLDFFSTGWNGVNLFFVLSGFLIGNLVFIEIKNTGTLKLRRFWIRRALRTWPLYFLLLAFQYFRTEPELRPSLLPFLTFTQNLKGTQNFFLQTWSLAVEEQFYFFLPLLLLAVLKWATLARFKWIIALGVLSSYVFRACYAGGIHTLSVIDSLWVGVFVSYLHSTSPHLLDRWCRWPNRAFALGLALVYGPYLIFGTGASSAVLLSTSAVGFGIILTAALHPQLCIRKFLSSRILSAIGLVSYSIYLTHDRVLFRVSQWSKGHFYEQPVLESWFTFAFALLGSILLGALMYALVERPFLKLRERRFPKVSC